MNKSKPLSDKPSLRQILKKRTKHTVEVFGVEEDVGKALVFQEHQLRVCSNKKEVPQFSEYHKDLHPRGNNEAMSCTGWAPSSRPTWK
jgi:hypothetical protein